MKISVFGLGYVGCVCLGCFAENGHEVIGVDLNDTKINFINMGKATIVEDEIDNIIYRQHKLGKITATPNGYKAVKNTEISFICVGTPSSKNGHLNLEAIFKVAEEIGKAIKDKAEFHTVVIRSTVMPGTNKIATEIIEQMSGKKCDKNFAVVSNPEFLREGSSVNDFNKPPYTLIGTTSTIAIEKLKNLYKNIDSPFILTDIKIAEIIKYVNNAFHALKISFANEIGNICNKLEIDSHELMDIFCLDKKLNISPYYLKPGFAYGGSCLPKDLKGLKTIAHDYYLNCPILENIEISNEIQKKLALDSLLRLGSNKIGFYGLSFKAGTDDLRNSPIIDIIEILIGKGFDIRVYDKCVHLSKLTGTNKDYILNKIPLISNLIIDNPDELIDHSDIIVIMNKDSEIKNVLDRIPEEKIIYDLIRIDHDHVNKFKNYYGINW